MNFNKPEPSIFIQACPSRDIFARISGKWTIMILLSLENKPRRFNELKKVIGGISQKVLTENLRGLERDGLVIRNVVSSRPIKVEYFVTPLTRELLRTLNDLKDWTEKSMKLIMKNNEKYDSDMGKSLITRTA